MGKPNQNATNKVETPVTKEIIIPCSIKSVQVYQSTNSDVRYRVTIDTLIDAIKKDTDGNYITAQVDYIDFVPRVIIAQCINCIDGLDLMYTKKKEQGIRNDNAAGFGAAELQVVLRGAKLDVKRTKFEIGDEYTNADGIVNTHENAGYNTDIVKIKVSERVQLKLDEMLDKVFDL